jgi:hypothetical protein
MRTSCVPRTGDLRKPAHPPPIAPACRPNAGSPIAYAAAKAGIELLTKDAAAQAGPHGIRVNCIAPKTMMTETNQQQIPAQVQESLRESHPIRRLGTPDDVAQMALFLASDNSAWVSGIVVDVAGGSVSRPTSSPPRTQTRWSGSPSVATSSPASTPHHRDDREGVVSCSTTRPNSPTRYSPARDFQPPPSHHRFAPHTRCGLLTASQPRGRD